MRGGISISDEHHNSYGTLGGLVRDRASGVEMILSNWHVLVADWNARAGQQIYQPGRLDGGTGADAVATLTRDAMPVNLDAAVAALNRSRRLINDQYDLGSVRGVAQPRVGMQVVKSGRRSNVTYGRVEAIEGTAQINYGPTDRVIQKIVRILPRAGFQDQVSEPGDSGSFWLNAETRQAIGLHFAGATLPETALAMDMQTVLNALNVDLVSAA
jgi:endonuclease G